MVLIGGGCTGAVQPLDTHLHGPFSNTYQQIEMEDLLRQAAEDETALPRLRRAELMSIVVSVWQK